MKLSSPHLICIDIDGTLTDSQDRKISEETAEVISSVQKLGHKVVINTGRSYSNLPDVVLGTSPYFDAFCCANGTYIKSGENVIQNVTFSNDVLFRLLDYTIHQNNRFCLFEGEELLLKVTDSSPLYGSPGTRVYSAEEVFQKYPNPSINVLSCEGQLTPDFFNLFEKDAQIFQAHSFADIIPFGCSKATGLSILADYFGIPLSNTVAIGDSANDIPMLKAAKISVAMENAPEDIRKQATMVTTSNNDSGVAKALRALFLNS